MKVNSKKRAFSSFNYGELARGEVVSPIAPQFPLVHLTWLYLFSPEPHAFYIFIDNLVDPQPCEDHIRLLLPQPSPGSSRCQLGSGQPLLCLCQDHAVHQLPHVFCFHLNTRFVQQMYSLCSGSVSSPRGYFVPSVFVRRSRQRRKTLRVLFRLVKPE